MKKRLSSVFWILFTIFFVIVGQSMASETWNFSSSIENWYERGSATVEHSFDGNGRLYMRPSGSDPGMVRSNLSINALKNNIFKAYIWTYCSDQKCELFFKRSGSSSVYSGGIVFLNRGSAGCEYAIDLSNNSNWQGIITELRIDPTPNCGSAASPGFIAFDWIDLKQKNGSITGGVRNSSDSNPINDALVRLEQNNIIKYSAYSYSGGTYQFNNIIPGTYNLVAIKFGYDNWLKSVLITSNETSQNITMEPNVGSISGGTRDNSTSIAINSALIRLEQNNIIKHSSYSDSTGNYEFNNIVPGNYNLVSLKSGYCNWIKSVNIIAGNNLSQNIAIDQIMVSKPGTPIGKTDPTININYLYETSGSSACIGYSIEYCFDWDDGSISPWSKNLYANKVWTQARDGGFDVQINARCKEYPDKKSASDIKKIYPKEPNTLPTIAISSPNNRDSFDYSNITVSGTANDSDLDGSIFKVQIRIDEGDWQDVVGTESWSASIILAEGVNTIQVKAQDNDLDWSSVVLMSVIFKIPDVAVKEVFIQKDNWYHLYDADDLVTIKVIVEEGSDCVNSFISDVAIASNFSLPNGVTFFDVKFEKILTSNVYVSCISLSKFSVIKDAPGANEKDELFFIELDRDLQDTNDYTGVLDEDSHAQNFLKGISQIPKKSIASANGNKAMNIPPATKEYFESGGFEKVSIETQIKGFSFKDTIFVKNQADWMIYTGHGASCTGAVALRSNTNLLNTDYIKPDEFSFLNEDLDGVFLFNCSVLDIKDYNDNYPNDYCDEESPNPGLRWIDVFTNVKLLLGYNYTAPTIIEDNGGVVLEAWKKYWLVDEKNALDSWHQASSDYKGSSENAAAIDIKNSKYYYWKILKIENKTIPYWWSEKTIQKEDEVEAALGGGFYEAENLTAAAISTSQINLAWDRGLNPIDWEMEYVIIRYNSYSDEIEFSHITSNTGYQDINLESGIVYYYWVGAFIGNCEPIFSEPVNTATNSEFSGGGENDDDITRKPIITSISIN